MQKHPFPAQCLLLVLRLSKANTHSHSPRWMVRAAQAFLTVTRPVPVPSWGGGTCSSWLTPVKEQQHTNIFIPLPTGGFGWANWDRDKLLSLVLGRVGSMSPLPALPLCICRADGADWQVLTGPPHFVLVYLCPLPSLADPPGSQLVHSESPLQGQTSPKELKSEPRPPGFNCTIKGKSPIHCMTTLKDFSFLT